MLGILNDAKVHAYCVLGRSNVKLYTMTYGRRKIHKGKAHSHGWQFLTVSTSVRKLEAMATKRTTRMPLHFFHISLQWQKLLH